jgi:hypothetical protein
VEPNVQIVGACTVPAQARATILNGAVTRIGIVTAGSGYTQPPTILISSPYNVGFGTYIFNETVVGSTSGVVARVKSWNATTSKLELSNITGNFLPGEVVVGAASSATYQIKLIDTYNTTDPFSQNKEIQVESDLIIDFSETNPFGNP